MSGPELTVAIEAPAIHRRGYPMLVAVTIGNPVAGLTYFALPPVERFRVPPPVEFVVTRAGADAGEVLPAEAGESGEDEPKGMRLAGGDARRMLFDLSELDPHLVAGPHRLDARYLGPVVAHANAVSFEVEVPSDDEAAAVARLRASNRAGEASWSAFLTDNFREIEARELDKIPPEGRAELAFTLALHRAIYGPLGVDRLDPALFRGLAGVPLDELAVLEHELLAARGDPNAGALASTILASLPALAYRIEANDRRRGALRIWRMLYGAERSFPAVPDPLPYSRVTP
jgi:hypothetical protein